MKKNKQKINFEFRPLLYSLNLLLSLPLPCIDAISSLFPEEVSSFQIQIHAQ